MDSTYIFALEEFGDGEERLRGLCRPDVLTLKGSESNRINIMNAIALSIFMTIYKNNPTFKCVRDYYINIFGRLFLSKTTKHINAPWRITCRATTDLTKNIS